MRVAKDMLRREMKDRRSALPPALHASQSAAAAAHLLALPEVAAAAVIALYGASRDETDTAALHDALADKILVYPRVVPDTPLLSFFAVTDRNALFRSETLGVLEPPPAALPVALIDIQIFVVPGLAFDAHGARVGWGRGHYDHTLAAAPQALRVGYAFEFQIAPAVPTTSGDEHMDLLCTDAGIRAANPGRLR